MCEILGKTRTFSLRCLISVGLTLIAIGAVWFLLKLYSGPKEIRHIVLISIDTCRADYLSCYGYHRKTTPNIDTVAKNGVLFTNVVTSVPITLPAHSSMLTGTIPPYHGAHDNNNYKLANSNLTLAEILRANGFVTGAFISAFVLDAQFGLDQGFDTYQDDIEVQNKKKQFSYNQRKAEETNRYANLWLEKYHRDKFFLFLHYFDPHNPYEPPEPFATDFADNLYAGEIAYTDYCIGQVIKKLKELSLYDSTLLIITADHGEMLGEHGEATHCYFIYESAIKVPLIMKIPDGPRNKIINDEVVGLIDIVPTVCSFLGITIPSSIQGKDLSGCFASQPVNTGKRYVYCESLYPTKYGCSPLLGVVGRRWKYIQTPKPELYDLTIDRKENNNLANIQPNLARLMQDHLRQTLKENKRSNLADSKLAMNAESIRRLQSLGYVTAERVKETFEFDQNSPDPKDLIHVHRAFFYLLTLMDEKKYQQAKSECEKLLKDQPDMIPLHALFCHIAFDQNDVNALKYHASQILAHRDQSDSNDSEIWRLKPNYHIAHNYLGVALVTEGKIKEAITHYTKALEYNPLMAEAHYNIAEALLKQDKLNEASIHYNEAIRLSSDKKVIFNSHESLTWILLKQEKFDQVIEHYSQMLKIEPNNTSILNDMGTVLSRQGKVEEAVKQWSLSLQLNPEQAQVHEWIGTLQASRKNPDEAVRHWTESLRINPTQPTLHYNVGTIHYFQGNLEKAGYHWKRALELKPDWPDVLNNMAWLLTDKENTQFSDPNEAIRLAHRACELTDFNRPDFLDTLSAAYAAADRFSEAVEIAQKALDLAQATNQQQLAGRIQNRLEIYKDTQSKKQ